MDYSALAAAADFSGALTAGAAIAGGVILVLVGVKGAKMVFRFLS